MLDKLAKFIEIKCFNPKLEQSEIARELKLSLSTLQRDRREINILLPYRIPRSSNTTHTRKQKSSNHTEHDLKLTSNDIKITSKDANKNDKPVSKKVKTKNKLRVGEPNDKTTHGKVLVEQPFSSPING